MTREDSPRWLMVSSFSDCHHRDQASSWPSSTAPVLQSSIPTASALLQAATTPDQASTATSSSSSQASVVVAELVLWPTAPMLSSSPIRLAVVLSSRRSSLQAHHHWLTMGSLVQVAYSVPVLISSLRPPIVLKFTHSKSYRLLNAV
ncbi:hypothetical protein Bca4012_026329 [Brassica carinata]